MDYEHLLRSQMTASCKGVSISAHGLTALQKHCHSPHPHLYGLHVLPNRTSGHDPFNWHAMLTFSVQARIAGRCYLACQIRSNALMGKGALHQVDVVSVRISEAHPISNDFSHLYAWTIALRNQNPKYLKQLNDESCRLTCMRRECVTKSIGDSFWLCKLMKLTFNQIPRNIEKRWNRTRMKSKNQLGNLSYSRSRCF